MANQRQIFLALGCLAACLAAATVALAQDYDDENYQGGSGPGAGGAGAGQADADGYQSGYGNDDGYSGNMPNYQQNVDSDSTNQSPASSYPGQAGAAGSGDADGDYEGDDSSAAASEPRPSLVRARRSVELAAPAAAAGAAEPKALASEPKVRVKRHGKYYIGPVYTYVKTDKHANFKWGVKHKVGKKHYG